MISISFNHSCTTQQENPTLRLETLTPGPVAVGKKVQYELTMTIPENSEGTYFLDVLTPYNNSAPRMEICDVYVSERGSNVPCFTDEVKIHRRSILVFITIVMHVMH